MERSAASIRLGPKELDHLAPLLGFLRNEFPEIGGRAYKRRASQVGKPRLHLGISEARVDLLVELVDDLVGVCLGAPEPASNSLRSPG